MYTLAAAAADIAPGDADDDDNDDNSDGVASTPLQRSILNLFLDFQCITALFYWCRHIRLTPSVEKTSPDT